MENSTSIRNYKQCTWICCINDGVVKYGKYPAWNSEHYLTLKWCEMINVYLK